MAHKKLVMARLNGDVTYGRFVGEIFCDGKSLNRELVRDGLAWWNKSYEERDWATPRTPPAAREEPL